jgi:LPS sulfotransferase NodH
MISFGRIHQVWPPVRSMLRRIGLLRAMRRRAAELRTYLRVVAAGSHMPATKFVIFAQGRTGSDLLASLLNAHPEVFCDGEILARKVLFPMALVNGRCAGTAEDVYGYKLKIYHITEGQQMYDPRRFVTRLHANGWRILYLRRRNILRQAISGFVAEERGAYQHRLTDGPLELAKISVDCDELLRRMDQRAQYFVQERKALEGLPHMIVVYEDHLLKAENHQETMDRVFDYLGVPFVTVRTDLVKITPERLSDFLDNYDEIARVVGNSEYARFLGDQACHRRPVPSPGRAAI